jgi:hypothetical protein
LQKHSFKLNFFISYSPGSGGNFIDNIFRYYNEQPYHFRIDETTGSVDKSRKGATTSLHVNADQILLFRLQNPTATLVGIKLTADNVDHVARMHYFKFTERYKIWVTNKKNVSAQWPEYADQLLDPDPMTRQLSWIQVNRVGSQDWIRTFDDSKFDIVLPFDTMLGRGPVDLNTTVANIFEKTPDPAVESYIANWQNLASKYVVH